MVVRPVGSARAVPARSRTASTAAQLRQGRSGRETTPASGATSRRPETGPAPATPTEPTACGPHHPQVTASRAVGPCARATGASSSPMQTDGNLVAVLERHPRCGRRARAARAATSPSCKATATSSSTTRTASRCSTRTRTATPARASRSRTTATPSSMGGGGGALWNSDTGGIPTKPTACGVIAAVSRPRCRRDEIASCDKRSTSSCCRATATSSSITAKVRALGEQDRRQRRAPPPQPCRAMATSSRTAPEGTVIWESQHERVHAGAHLAVQTDGNLVHLRRRHGALEQQDRRPPRNALCAPVGPRGGDRRCFAGLLNINWRSTLI